MIKRKEAKWSMGKSVLSHENLIYLKLITKYEESCHYRIRRSDAFGK